MRYYIGIDPGSKGAMAVLNQDGEVVDIRDLTSNVMDYAGMLIYVCYPTDSYSVAVEDVRGRPGQSCIANTTFMKLAGYAELLGASFAVGNPNSDYFKVSPLTWKKHFGLTTKGLTKTERKHLSIDLAKRFFPSVADKLTASKDGRAEALLIAKYCKEVLCV